MRKKLSIFLRIKAFIFASAIASATLTGCGYGPLPSDRLRQDDTQKNELHETQKPNTNCEIDSIDRPDGENTGE